MDYPQIYKTILTRKVTVSNYISIFYFIFRNN
jgi:hypothetical protein